MEYLDCILYTYDMLTILELSTAQHLSEENICQKYKSNTMVACVTRLILVISQYNVWKNSRGHQDNTSLSQGYR